VADRSDWNRAIIEEFRANAGKVGGPFEGLPLLLLTTGARSGNCRTILVGYLPDGERFVIFATTDGRPNNTDWSNLVAHPEAPIEVTAVVFTGQERDQLWARQLERAPVFAE